MGESKFTFGIVAGLISGSIIGVTMDNLAVAIAFGMGTGVALGLAWPTEDKSRHPDKSREGVQPCRQQPERNRLPGQRAILAGRQAGR